MSHRKVGLVVALLLGTGAARAGEVIHQGVRVRFELVRVPAGPEEPVVEAVGGSAAGVHRVLLDREHGRYFGYTVHVSALNGGRYRVWIGPLAREWREQAARLYGEVAGDPEAIEYPEPVEVDAGEPLLFECSRTPRGGTLSTTGSGSSPSIPSTRSRSRQRSRARSGWSTRWSGSTAARWTGGAGWSGATCPSSCAERGVSW